MNLKFFTTGGTIDKVYFDALSRYEIGPPQAGEILRQAGVVAPFSIEPLLDKDSLDLTAADRLYIRRQIEADRAKCIVITHGTDTMIETAKKLLGIPGKTIVLTGAMQPARFRETDAVFNLGMAVAAVQCLPPGVYLALQGRIFDPRKTRKNRERQCFEEIPEVKPKTPRKSPKKPGTRTKSSRQVSNKTPPARRVATKS